VLISTVLPGTIRKEFIPLCTNFRFIYNPYLIAMGTVKEDMIKPEMIIIGTEDGSRTGDANMLTEFYGTFVYPKTRCEIGTWDEAESIKINKQKEIESQLVIDGLKNQKEIADNQNLYSILWRGDDWRITDIRQSNDKMKVTYLCYRNDPTTTV
jgi:hypothetical protein